MKTHIISFNQPSSILASIFNPRQTFKADWCLDYHGVFDHQEFERRLDLINRTIAHLPLMTVLTERILMLIAVIISFAITMYLVIVLQNPFQGASLTSIIFTMMVVASKLLIKNMAETRAREFTNALKKLFESNEFNGKDYPTAYWSVVWIPVIAKWKLEATSSTIASAKPKFIEQVKVILDINDALSDLTAHTVHVRLPRRQIGTSMQQTNSHAYNNLPPQMGSSGQQMNSPPTTIFHHNNHL